MNSDHVPPERPHMVLLPPRPLEVAGTIHHQHLTRFTANRVRPVPNRVDAAIVDAQSHRRGRCNSASGNPVDSIVIHHADPSAGV